MIRSIESIGVFCGSSAGHDPVYSRVATQLGGLLAQRGIALVYGGAHVGLMGSIAEAALASGGKVVGVIPQSLMQRELAHQGLTELRVVSTMAERKELIIDMSDAFIALPGSIGTLDELFEVWTTAQLGLHAKPCALLNTLGYFDQLLAFLDNVVDQGFMRHSHRNLLHVNDNPQALLAELLDSSGA